MMRRPPRGYTNSFRIIGGLHRSRRFAFPPLAGLRPTPDRVRQTLFDWLAPVSEGARCLDLFAGSGALGLEALSRGASRVVFVERELDAADAIADHLAALGATATAEVRCGDALPELGRLPGPFDVVFLDPPFDSGSLAPAFAALVARDSVAPHGSVYLEGPADAPLPTLPEGWRLHRSKRAGNVGSHLVSRG